MSKKSIYTNCTSGIIQRGETLFPFRCFDIDINWDAVYNEMPSIKEVEAMSNI